MAKAKTTRKKSGSTSKKGSGKGGKKSSKSQTAQKKALVCEFCDKPMKDEKTKKLHESNCKKKSKGKTSPKKDKEVESAILKIKDEFEDQRKQLESDFKEREEKLHKELSEIKEVLRLEMERRHAAHKETEMQPKADKDIKDSEQPTTPEAKPEPAQPEPIREEPKAIDRIPAPLPEIPERKVPEDYDGPRVEVLEVGSLGPTAEEVAVASRGMERDEILEIVKGELEMAMTKIQDSTPEPVAASQDMEPITQEFDKLRSEITGLKLAFQESQARKVSQEDSGITHEFKRIDRELAKFSDKIAEIMDEIGFGESLSVSKIPPTILEIVYQATLDDLMKELIKTVGSQDAEKISRLALEEVRLKTSGSELFKFDGRKIVTDNLAKSIEKDLISATQIQTTYDELLDRFLEHLPHHKAKNFRAMIKVKSQEFAVDRATVLTKKLEKVDKNLDSTSQMLAALSAQISAKNLKLEEELREIKEKLVSEKADVSELELLRSKVREREDREAELAKEIGLLKAEKEMEKKLAKSKKDKGEAEEKKTEEKVEEKKEEEKAEDKPDYRDSVLKAITGGASSKTAINRETGLAEDDILATVAELVKGKKIVEKKVGKRFKYQTPDQALEEELGKKEKKKKPAKKKEAKPKEEKEPPKEDKAVMPGDKEHKPAAKDEKKAGERPTKKKKPAKKGAKQTKKVPEPEKKKPAGKEKKVEVKAEPEKKGEDEKVEKKKQAKPAKKKVTEPEEAKAKPTAKETVKTEAEPPTKEKAEEPEKADIKPEDVEVEKELPAVTKTLDELNDEEKKVLEVITEDGLTMSGIRSKVDKDMKYMSVLRALRVLIDSGLVGGVTKGRLTLYQKIKVEKVDEKEKEGKDKEVK